jgi:hypothetical protein
MNTFRYSLVIQPEIVLVVSVVTLWPSVILNRSIGENLRSKFAHSHIVKTAVHIKSAVSSYCFQTLYEWKM